MGAGSGGDDLADMVQRPFSSRKTLMQVRYSSNCSKERAWPAYGITEYL